MTELTQARAKELFTYEPFTGDLFRKISLGSAKAGLISRTDFAGYLCVYIHHKSYYAHRVIWLLVHGNFPKYQIDHIDGDKTNNRINNLRDVSQKQNSRNACLSIRNTSGRVGVSWDRVNKNWRAKITVNYQDISLGSFSNKADAISAREDAEKQYGFHPNHGRRNESEGDFQEAVIIQLTEMGR